MIRQPYLEAVRDRVIVFDGAFGTFVQDLDLGPDDFGGDSLEGCNEMLCLTRPDVIEAMHRAFLDAGVDVQRVTTVAEARERGLVANEAALVPGDRVELALHPLGTDYLGRDMLARLMAGARVSLFIGIGAPLCFVLFGVFFGSVAGFIGGKTDQVMMRFADFVVALPFLLFMILFKIAFGIGPGESGVMPMLVALVLLMWPATARLVRGQILQIREQGYISASQLLGAKTHYLILRHMLPNTLGVVLVTLTFAIPSAIFTEAFLSFIGMGSHHQRHRGVRCRTRA